VWLLLAVCAALAAPPPPPCVGGTSASTYASAALKSLSLPRLLPLLRDGRVPEDDPGERKVGGGDPPHPHGVPELLLYAIRNARRALQCGGGAGSGEERRRQQLAGLEQAEAAVLGDVRSGAARRFVHFVDDEDRPGSADDDERVRPASWALVERLLLPRDGGGVAAALREVAAAAAAAAAAPTAAAAPASETGFAHMPLAHDVGSAGRVPLRSGASMPLVGFGLGDVFSVPSVPGGGGLTGGNVGERPGDEARERAAMLLALGAAVLSGVRHFDSAESYGLADAYLGELLAAATDDAAAGTAAAGDAAGEEDEGGERARLRQRLAPLGLSRADFFVATKVSRDESFGGGGRTAALIARQLRALRTPYIDLVYLHTPAPHLGIGDTWRELEGLVGPAKAIRDLGISNFERGDAERLLAEGVRHVKPSVLQNKFDPLHPAVAAAGGGAGAGHMHAWCRANGVQMVAYSSLNMYPHELGAVADAHIASIGATPRPASHPRGARRALTAAQVALRWALQLGVGVLPKSSTPARIESNAQLLDFALEPSEMRAVSGLAWALAHDEALPDFVRDVHGFVGPGGLPPAGGGGDDSVEADEELRGERDDEEEEERAGGDDDDEHEEL
jgi:diketogulonate reductase-like aldo/keto reductase